MAKVSKIQKISALIMIQVFLGACITPNINGIQITPITNNDEFFGYGIASKVVYAKLQEFHKTDFTIKEIIEIKNDNKNTLCYVFNLDPQGYLVVSGSYDLPPIIAYSFLNNFYTNSEINPLYDLLCADITYRLENIQQIPENIIQKRHFLWDSYDKQTIVPCRNFEQWPPEGSTSTGGWVLTTWNQNAPYNNFCPLDLANGEKRSVAGCPAVAMAQILNYHSTTNNVMFNDTDDYYHNYGGNRYWIDNDYVEYDFPSFPQLNSYLQTIQSNYQYNLSLNTDDIASLIFACGIASTQVYGAAGSGTFGVDQAYEAYQRFNCTTMSLLDDNDPDVYDRLSSNMINALPAHLAVVNEDWTSGHNVVVDGYNTDDFYHLNFGWGGAYDGWYLLPDEFPYGLTVLEGVIVDIMAPQNISHVQCNGTIHLTNITPSATLTESFTVENAGSPGSLLHWEITEYPEWGTWTFTPSSGIHLTPEQGQVTVNISIIAPEKKNREYNGYIKITNLDNTTDCDIIQVTLATSYKPHSILYNILQNLRERFIYPSLLLHLLLNY